MRRGTCTRCGDTFEGNTKGRPAKRCPGCRDSHDHAFRKIREATRDAAVGTPCRRCGQPMLDPREMDLGHDDATGEIAGWEHASCNRSAGAHLANARKRATNGRAPSPAQVAALGMASPPPQATVRPGQQLPVYATRKGPAFLSPTTGAIVRTCTCDTYPEPHEVPADMISSRCW